MIYVNSLRVADTGKLRLILYSDMHILTLNHEPEEVESKYAGSQRFSMWPGRCLSAHLLSPTISSRLYIDELDVPSHC